jgi:hypothetical protein
MLRYNHIFLHSFFPLMNGWHTERGILCPSQGAFCTIPLCLELLLDMGSFRWDALLLTSSLSYMIDGTIIGLSRETWMIRPG